MIHSLVPRCRCLFELYTAIGEHGRVGIDVILSSEQHTAFLDAMNREGYRCVDQALSEIRSENATATIAADLEAIRRLVQSTPGGFEQLNNAVRIHLAGWFEGQGTIKTSVRMVGRTSLAVGDGVTSPGGGLARGRSNASDGSGWDGAVHGGVSRIGSEQAIFDVASTDIVDDVIFDVGSTDVVRFTTVEEEVEEDGLGSITEGNEAAV